MLVRSFGRILLNAAATEPTGGSAATTAAAPDLKKEVDGLVAAHGDSTSALLVLLGRTHSDRDTISDLRKKLPADGSIVLAGDDAKAWGEYRKLGDLPSLRKSLDQGKLDASDLGTYRKSDSIRAAAKVTKIDGSMIDPDVLGPLARDLDLVVDDLKDDKGNPIGEDGKLLARDAAPVKAAFVKEGDKLTRLDGYAKANWAKFLPSLKTQAQGGSKAGGSPTTHRERPIPAAGSGATARAARRSTL